MDERAELKELIGGARALLELYASTGCDGVLADGDVAETLALLEARPARPAAPRLPALGARPAAPPPRAAPAAAAAAAPAAAARPAPAPPVASFAPAARAATATAHAVASPASAAAAPLPSPEPAVAPEERRRRLAVLADAMRGCTACGLSAGRTQTVYARGNPAAELVFIGEAPGADEDRIGEPFVGKAGQLLDKMIAAMGYGRDDVYVCNVTKCRPPDNRKPEPLEMATCLPHLHEQLAVVQPRAIVALGATAVQGLLGATEGITRLRGTWKLYRGAIPVMPTFHPAYLLRDPSKKAEVWKDLQAVMQQLGKALPKRGASPER